jgi:hypothetical protein
MIVIPLGLLIAAAVVLQREDGAQSDREVLEGAIRDTTASRKWTPPMLSKYFAFQYPPKSKLRYLAEAYRWPGSLDRGLGKDVLKTAVRIAHERYGLAVDGVTINGPANPRHINIYFFDPDISPRYQAFKRQCVYLGFGNTILCDAQFLFQFQEVRVVEQALDTYLSNGQHFSTLLETLHPVPVRVAYLLRDLAATQDVLLWAIAHEIGHLAHRHQPVSTLMYLLSPSKSRKKAESLEIEADEYAVEVLQSSVQDGALLVYVGMGDVTAGLIAQALHAPGGQLPVRLEDLRDRIPTHRSYGSHPPMLVRMLDALTILEKQYGEIGNLSDPTFARLRSQVEFVP